VNALRLQRKMQFVIVRDHTGMVQVTHKRDDGLLESQREALTSESAVRITGRVVDAAQVKLGGLESSPKRSRS
jgi:aspartyl-tRNA synthetase